MNITEIKNDKTDFHVKVTIPSKEISSEIEKELAKLAKDAKIDGFRVGKVPTSFLEKKYGASLRADLQNTRCCLQEAQRHQDQDYRR